MAPNILVGNFYWQQNKTYYVQVETLKAVTDKNHNIIKEITYDTYGNMLNDTNPNINIPFGFAGGLHDKNTNLVHFGYREYEPLTGLLQLSQRCNI